MKIRSRTVFLLFLLITVYSSINYYIGWHLTDWLDALEVSYSPWLFWIPFGIVAFSYIAARISLPGMLTSVGRLLKVIGSYYIFIMEAGFLLFILSDLVELILYWTGVLPANYSLYSGSAVIALLAIFTARGSRNAWSPIVREYELDIAKTPIAGGQKEWTVAMASDIHLGNTVGRRHLAKLVSRMNAMEPDLILLPGDVIDDSIEPFLRNRMGEVLGQLKAKRGIYAVLGNHEYYGGHIDQYVAEMNKIGIRVLRDETVDIGDELSIAGRKDKSAESMEPAKRQAVSELIQTLDKDKPIILMDHQPTKFAAAADAGADVMLSGHTHRGQFVPNHLFTKRLFELDWGYMRKGAMHVVVSSGFGTWGPPIRLGSRSEIIKLKIKLGKV
ncbi:metallophosphoesterase [Cohnella mopanensis]|uniref:metallophosphoesterase n=1 Tax=Cohnella mopanensis TaxID=2911966 RepID=UPI001EF937C9|nr:metallophosphoesterase [Cohnella mopanensis]